jgi:hypothetical protein
VYVSSASPQSPLFKIRWGVKLLRTWTFKPFNFTIHDFLLNSSFHSVYWNFKIIIIIIIIIIIYSLSKACMPEWRFAVKIWQMVTNHSTNLIKHSEPSLFEKYRK